MSWQSCRNSAVHRKCTCPANHQEYGDCEHKQVKFKSLAFLISVPIHEESKGVMYRRNCYNHVGGNSECSDSGKETNDEPQAAEKFRRNREECQGRWNMHFWGEESHRAGEPKPAKPSQHLLGPMGKEDDSQNESHNRCANAVVSRNDVANHVPSPNVLALPARIYPSGCNIWIVDALFLY